MAYGLLLDELESDPFDRFFAEARREALGEPPELSEVPADELPRPLRPAPVPPPEPLPAPARPKPIFLGNEPAGRKAKPQPFFWSLADQSNAFLLAVGSSGSGKTELLRVLGHELGAQGVPLVCLDFHGDLHLAGLPRVELGPRIGVNPLEVSSGGPRSQRQRTVIRQLLHSVVSGLGHVQGDLLNKSLDEVLASPSAEVPTLADLRAVLRAREATLNERLPARGLLAALGLVFDDAAFHAPRNLSTAQLLRAGASIDLSGLSKPGKVIAAGAILAQIFETLCAAGPLPGRGQLRCFVLLDEAAILGESEFVDVLAKESRKFGLGFAVATQEVQDLSKSLRANAASAAVFHALTEQEAKEGAKLFRGVGPDELMHLQVGECYFRDAAGLRRLRIVPTFERETR